MPIGGIISGIGSIFGGASASAGAEAQARAQEHAADLQFQEFGQIQQNEQPFLSGGTNAFENILALYGLANVPGVPTGAFNNTISSVVGPPPSPFDASLTGQINAAGGWSMGAPPNPNDPALRAAFTASPGYGYQIEQMTDAVQNSAAGRTGAISGPMLSALQHNAQGLASQDWWNNYNAGVNSWANGNNNWWNLYNAAGNNYGQRYQDVANQRNQMVSVLGQLGAAGQNAAANLGGFGQAAATSIGNAGVGAANARSAGSQAMTNGFTQGATSIGNSISSFLNPNSGNGSSSQSFLMGAGSYPGGAPSSIGDWTNSGANYAYAPNDYANYVGSYGYAGV